MKDKIFIISLLIIAVFSAGCLDFTVYDTYEEVNPRVVSYTGTVTDPYNMDINPADTKFSDGGEFASGQSGNVLLRNTVDPFTKSTYETPYTFIIDVGCIDRSSNGINGELFINIIADNGFTSSYPITLPDYDGFAHVITLSPDYDFSFWDDNGDGVISVEVEHKSTDQNVIKVYYVAMGFNYDETPPTEPEPPTPPTTTTGNVEFYTDPTGASISVDGVYKGTSSLTVSGLSEGAHSWSISKTGYNTKTGTVNVIAGENAVVVQTLTAVEGEPEPETPLPTANIPPTAVITKVQPSQSMVVFNSDKSTDSDGSIVKREWFLNDKLVTTAVQYQMSTSDKAVGEYIIKLTITDDDGATNDAIVRLTIDEAKTIVKTEEVTVPISDEVTPTTEEEETPTTFTIPGFEAAFALIGLLAVVWLIKRDEE